VKKQDMQIITHISFYKPDRRWACSRFCSLFCRRWVSFQSPLKRREMRKDR